MSDDDWFKIDDYPYFKRLREYAVARARTHRHGALVEAEIKEKGPIGSLVLLFMAHSSGQRGATEDMVAGVKDFIKLAKAAPEDVLGELDDMIAQLSEGDDNPLFCQLIDLERQRRRGELEDWGAQFDGRQVSIYAEPKK